MTVKTSQNGNVLVLILAAVALLGVLTYTMMRSGSDANRNLVPQKEIDLGVQEMLRYGLALENAIYQMVMNNGVSADEISFDSSHHTGYVNANCTTDICKLFLPNGGGIAWREVPAAVRGSANYIFSGASPIYGHGTDGADADNSDLIMIAPVSATACEAAGRIVEVPFTDASGPNDALVSTKFTGTYGFTAGKAIDAAGLTGHKAFCYEDTDATAYYFVYVLYSR